MLANIFLHEMLDVWFTEPVRPRFRGRASLVRFAAASAVACSDRSSPMMSASDASADHATGST
jgi:hypothetical protein